MIRNSCFEVIITRECIFLNKNLKNPRVLLRKMFFYGINVNSNIINKKIKGDNNKTIKHIYR